jgi:hypothetical protein
MNATLVKVLDIAVEVRAWAEAAAAKQGKIHGHLNGWCAIASGELHKRLLKAKVRAELHMALDEIGCHVYVVVEDHVVDVTATQFREFKHDPVVIKHHKEIDHLWFYQSGEVFHSARDLRKYQLREGWPNNQVAYG